MNIQIFFETPKNLGGELAIRVNNDLVGLKKAVFKNNQLLFLELLDYNSKWVQIGIQPLRGITTVRIHFAESKDLRKTFTQTIDLREEKKEKFILFDLSFFKVRYWGDKNLLNINARVDYPKVEIKRANRENTGANIPFKKYSESKDNQSKDFSYYEKQNSITELLTPLSKDGKNKIVEVFYATDRKEKKNNKKRITYTNTRGDLSLGRCVVSIPANKAKGALPTQPWYVFGTSGHEDKYMLIKEVAVLSPESFFQSIKNRVALSPEKDAFLFIHGYNVSFNESILRTAQIASDIGFQGAPVVYSWPSRHSLFGYTADESTATGYSTNNIIQILRDIRAHTNAERIHIIAHSMGNRIITDALKSLVDQGFNKEFLFNQIILAAPDIDAEVFIKEIAPKIVNSSDRVTLYASQADKPLWFSGNIHGAIQRAGAVTDRIAVIQGIDTIDTTIQTTDFLGHGYFAESKALIDDIFQTIKFNKSPAERNLREKKSGNNVYWEFW